MKHLIPVLLALAILAVAGCKAPASHANGEISATCSERLNVATEQEIAALFDRWNESLKTGDPQKVVANYAERSMLLPTLSSIPRFTAAEKEDYFRHFLEDRPTGEVTMRQIQMGNGMAVDTGLYTFTFAKTGKTVKARYSFTYRWDGRQWLIVSHHSSAMPE
jgi:uncharacterized protein (TIGR02246 family)